MKKLFDVICGDLERLPIDDTVYTIKFTRKDGAFPQISRFDVLKTADNKKELLKIMMKYGQQGKNLPIFSQIKHKGRQIYKDSAWRIAAGLLDSQEVQGGELWLALFKPSRGPLYCKKTQKRRLKAIEKLVGDNPAFYKTERNDSLGDLAHSHVLMLIPSDFTFPSLVNGYEVEYEKLGSRPNYKDKSLYENTTSFVRYMLKPADARCQIGKGKGRYRDELYFDWFQSELNRSTGKGKGWDKVALRGTINLDLNILRFNNLEEFEAAYSSVPILPPSLPTKHYIYPLPHNKKPATNTIIPSLAIPLESNLVSYSLPP